MIACGGANLQRVAASASEFMETSQLTAARDHGAKDVRMVERRVSPANVAMLVQGTEVYGVGTVERLYAMHWPELQFFALARGPLYDWLRERGSQVELIEGLSNYSSSRSWEMIARFPRAMRAAKRDAERIHERLAGRDVRIIHAHWRPQQYIAGYMRRRGYRSLWHIHNNSSRQRLFGLALKMNHWSARWGADLLVPVSRFIGANWENCGVPQRPILNCAVPLFDGPSELPTTGPVKCLVAGRVEASKGQHVAVEAVLRAIRSGCDVRLDLFGGPVEDNPYADELKDRIRAAGAGDAIQFKGFSQNLRELQRDYHLGLQCRIDPEPCSMWVCEALVDGLPLVASASGGTPELVDEGVTGLLYEPGNADQLADRILELAGDRPRLSAMRSAAFQRGREHFTVQRFLDETLDAYQTLVD